MLAPRFARSLAPFAPSPQKLVERLTKEADREQNEDAARALREKHARAREEILTLANRLWRAMSDPENKAAGITHDGYVKRFQLDHARHASAFKRGQVECLLLDEAQDCTDAMVDAVVSQRLSGQSVILAFDEHQTIYQVGGWARGGGGGGGAAWTG